MNKGLLIIGSILAATVMTGCGNKQQNTDGTKADSTQVVEDEEKDEEKEEEKEEEDVEDENVVEMI